MTVRGALRLATSDQMSAGRRSPEPEKRHPADTKGGNKLRLPPSRAFFFWEGISVVSICFVGLLLRLRHLTAGLVDSHSWPPSRCCNDRWQLLSRGIRHLLSPY